MFDMIREAGWPVFLVLGLGVPSLVLALRHAARPRRAHLVAAIGLGVAALIAGVLGTVLGVERSIEGVAKVAPEERWIFLLGLRESLHNIALACLLELGAAIALTIGSTRAVGDTEPR